MVMWAGRGGCMGEGEGGSILHTSRHTGIPCCRHGCTERIPAGTQSGWQHSMAHAVSLQHQQPAHHASTHSLLHLVAPRLTMVTHLYHSLHDAVTVSHAPAGWPAGCCCCRCGWFGDWCRGGWGLQGVCTCRRGTGVALPPSCPSVGLALVISCLILATAAPWGLACCCCWLHRGLSVGKLRCGCILHPLHPPVRPCCEKATLQGPPGRTSPFRLSGEPSSSCLTFLRGGGLPFLPMMCLK